MAEQKRITVAVTGHRPNKLFGYDLSDPRYNLMKQSFKNFLRKQNAGAAITGMALGVDTVFALAVLELKKEGYPIQLIAAIPCRNQESRWNQYDQHHYHDILRECNQTVYVTTLSYTPECMQQRNIWMVDHADCVLAVWDGTKGGTANCVNYAKQQQKNLFYLTPNQFQQNLTMPEQVNNTDKDLYVAGVTFNNDNGESRQEILCKLPKYVNVRLVHTTFTRDNGSVEPAIQVWEESTGKQLGFIPKNRIQQMPNMHKMVGVVRCYKDKWSCHLKPQEEPSAKLYHAVKTICKQHQLPMPVYDKQALSDFMAKYKKQTS